MLLREFIYFNKKQLEMQPDARYESDRDTSILSRDDVRKVRLTFRMLNELRIAGDAREKERKTELGLVRKMYAAPAPEGGAPAA